MTKYTLPPDRRRLYTRPVAQDLYAALGVPKHATTEEIKARHRQLANTSHPDKLDQSSPKYGAALEAWKAISEAYNVLKDDAKRSKYDFDIAEQEWAQAVLREQQRAAAAAAAAPRARPGQPLYATLRVPLLTAIKGGTVRHGAYEITIPRGTVTGAERRLQGKGGPGSPPGDLCLTVQVETHPLFTRVTHEERNGKQVKLKAPDLHMTATATWAEAYGGGVIAIPTPWGLHRYEVDPRDPDRNLFEGLVLRITGYGQRCNCNRPCSCPQGDLVVTWKLQPPEPGDIDLRQTLFRLQVQDPRADLAQAMMETTA
jgi:curved DNA-binding protein